MDVYSPVREVMRGSSGVFPNRPKNLTDQYYVSWKYDDHLISSNQNC